METKTIDAINDPTLEKPKAPEEPKTEATSSTSFFEEGEVEKDILERYKAMEQFEEDYKTFQDQAMKDLHNKQQDLFDAAPTDNPKADADAIDDSLPTSPPRPNSFKERLIRHREASGDSFGNLFPSSEDLTEGLDLDAPSLKRRLMELREGPEPKAPKQADAPQAQQPLEANETHDYTPSSEPKAPKPSEPSPYTPLLNPEDLPILKKNDPMKDQFDPLASRAAKTKPTKRLDEESDFPPLIDFEQLMQSDLGFKSKGNQVGKSLLERVRRPLIRALSVVLVVSSAVLLAFVIYLKRDAFVSLWERTFYNDAPLVIKENIGSEGLAKRPKSTASKSSLDEPLPRSDLKQATRYYVKWGMTLKTIAKDVYGDPNYWPYLYFYNEASINSLSRLVPVKDIIYLPPRDYLRQVPLASLYLRLARRQGNNERGKAYLRKARQLDPKLVEQILQSLRRRG